MRRRTLRHWIADSAGIAAVEFAIALPVCITLFFGGFVTMQTIALSRKVTLTTRTLADLTSQYTSMHASDMANVMGAATQVLAPFNVAPLGIRISEITTSANGLLANVTWSAASNATPYKSGTAFILPTGLTATPNMSLIYAETFYLYTPPFGGAVVGNIQLGDRIFMLPRLSSSVAYSGS